MPLLGGPCGSPQNLEQGRILVDICPKSSIYDHDTHSVLGRGEREGHPSEFWDREKYWVTFASNLAWYVCDIDSKLCRIWSCFCSNTALQKLPRMVLLVRGVEINMTLHNIKNKNWITTDEGPSPKRLGFKKKKHFGTTLTSKFLFSFRLSATQFYELLFIFYLPNISLSSHKSRQSLEVFFRIAIFLIVYISAMIISSFPQFIFMTPQTSISYQEIIKGQSLNLLSHIYLSVLSFMNIYSRAPRERGWQTYLPKNSVPRDIFQQRTMRIDGGEQRLSRAFSDGWPRVNTQLTQLGIETHPLPVRGRDRFVVLGANITAITGAITSGQVSLFKRYANLVSVLRKEIRNIPLKPEQLEQKRNINTLSLLKISYSFMTPRSLGDGGRGVGGRGRGRGPVPHSPPPPPPPNEFCSALCFQPSHTLIPLYWTNLDNFPNFVLKTL